ncbi:MAG: molybdate ABC transporter substrate-binding protein [Acidimicrobiia bacterium]|nr:molybdate ABC transporter substrate-binding protein [Acidimicrobiia bacterium]
MHHRRPTRVAYLVSALAMLSLALAACGDDNDSSSAASRAESTASGAGTSGSTTEARATGPVTVFAAASLTEAFTEIGAQFEGADPEADLTFNFAASSALVRQITEGAPADVYASADEANMTKLVDASGAAGEPQVFARNPLEIIVQPGNPKGITGLADLANSGVVFVTCAPEVPIGRYTADALQKAGVTATPASYEENVKAVATKVTLGEADAGVVYATDVAAAGASAEGVTIPEDHNVVASYPVATTSEAPNAEGAAAFVELVLSDDGQAVLEEFGFAAP